MSHGNLFQLLWIKQPVLFVCRLEISSIFYRLPLPALQAIFIILHCDYSCFKVVKWKHSLEKAEAQTQLRKQWALTGRVGLQEGTDLTAKCRCLEVAVWPHTEMPRALGAYSHSSEQPRVRKFPAYPRTLFLICAQILVLEVLGWSPLQLCLLKLRLVAAREAEPASVSLDSLVWGFLLKWMALEAAASAAMLSSSLTTCISSELCSA